MSGEKVIDEYLRRVWLAFDTNDAFFECTCMLLDSFRPAPLVVVRSCCEYVHQVQDIRNEIIRDTLLHTGIVKALKFPHNVEQILRLNGSSHLVFRKEIQ